MGNSNNQMAKKLLAWYDQHGRHNLPWQIQISPYKVWISEIMLQQTQVATVIPYFQRFLKSFPTLKKLSIATEDSVLAHWSGLGYYSRARNLHKTAKIIHEKYDGQFPKTVEDLCELPGIGRSTAGAILSLGMQKRAAILDGNVKRVLCRLYAIADWPGKNDVLKKLWHFAEELTPNERTHHYNQAIMDLGATICKPRQPSCNECPLNDHCKAYDLGQQLEFPGRKPRVTKPIKETQMLLIRRCNGELLLEKRPPVGIWASLWALPECSISEDIEDWCEKNHSVKVKLINEENEITHEFSHFKLIIHLKHVKVLGEVAQLMQSSSQIWYNTSNPLPGGIAAPLKKILSEMI